MNEQMENPIDGVIQLTLVLSLDNFVGTTLTELFEEIEYISGSWDQKTYARAIIFDQ